jgi:hypothetical protein
MIVVRVIGWVVLAAGIVVFGRDLLAWHDLRVLAPVSLSQLWLELNRGSLVSLQDALPQWIVLILRPVLALWAAPCLVLLGFVLAWSARKHRRRRRR